MNKQPKWSLQQQIKQRKTDELRRTIEAKQVLHPSTQRNVSAEPAAPRRRSTPPSTKQPVTIPTATHRSAERTLGWTKRRLGIVSVAAGLMLVVCLLTSLLAVRAPGSSEVAALPTTTANKAVNYLTEIGLPVTHVQPLSVPNENWNAKEEIQFNVGQASNSDVFVVLSYDSPAQAGVDGFRATYHRKFKQWNVIQISNLLLLSSPRTALPISDSVASHLTYYLITPYRGYMPTATANK